MMEQKINPEAREEASTYHATVDDFIALLWSRLSSASQAKLNVQRHEARKALISLSRLARKDEGQTLTVEQVGWLRMVLGRSLYRVEHFPEQSNDEGIEADELARAIILLGGEPAAPEPRPAEEGIAYRNPTDTIHNHASVSQNNGKEE